MFLMGNYFMASIYFLFVSFEICKFRCEYVIVLAFGSTSAVYQHVTALINKNIVFADAILILTS